jgi:hypothetical protein
MQTKDGGYIVGGNSESNNGDVTGMHDVTYGDFWIIKLDSKGNLEWEKALGGTDYDQANSIRQTSDGGYIAAGFSRSNNGDVTNAHGNYDAWITKLMTKETSYGKKHLAGAKAILVIALNRHLMVDTSSMVELHQTMEM